MSRAAFSLEFPPGGALDERLAAAQAAGFSQIGLWARDLVQYPGGYQAAVSRVRDSGLFVTCLRELHDYGGGSDGARDFKLSIAKQLLNICREVGAPLLLVTATAAPASRDDNRRAVEDLCRLANLAVPAGVRIGMSATGGGATMADARTAWDLVGEAGHANLGLVLDAADFVESGLGLEALNELPADRIVMARLADLGESMAGLAAAAAPRVFPGQGARPEALTAFLRHLDRIGFEGVYSLSVRHPDYRMLPAAEFAHAGARAMAWVNHRVLRRRLPLNQVGARQDTGD